MPKGGKGAGRFPDAARVAERQGEPRLALDKHFLTGIKAYPNQYGAMSRGALDHKSYAAFSDHLNAETAVLFSKPLIGLSTHAATFRQVHQSLDQFVQNGILGSTVTRIMNELQKKDELWNALDSFSPHAASRASNMDSTIKDATEFFTKMHTKVVWQELVVGLRQSAIRTLHLSQALQECMLFFGKDAQQVAKAIPAQQPHPELLAAAAKSSSALTAQPRLRRWLATALADKHQSYGHHTTTPTIRNFDNLQIEDDALAPEEDQGLNLSDEEAEAPPLSPASGSPPGSPAPVTPIAAPATPVPKTFPPAAKATTRRQQKAQSATASSARASVASQPAAVDQSALASLMQSMSAQLATQMTTQMTTLATDMNTRMDAFEQRMQSKETKQPVKVETKRKREVVEETLEIDDEAPQPEAQVSSERGESISDKRKEKKTKK